MWKEISAGLTPIPEAFVDRMLLVLYAISAVSGGLGGCAAAAWYIGKHPKPRWAMIAAYIILGVVFGVITLGISFFVNDGPKDLNVLALETIVGGASGAIALLSANLTARLIFRKLGVEVQLTVRRDTEERREPCDEELK